MAENLTNTLLKTDRIYCFSPFLFRAFFSFGWTGRTGPLFCCDALLYSHITALSTSCLERLLLLWTGSLRLFVKLHVCCLLCFGHQELIFCVEWNWHNNQITFYLSCYIIQAQQGWTVIAFHCFPEKIMS